MEVTQPSRPGAWDKAQYPILVSIHIQSNKPDHFRQFCDRLANSCVDPTRVELIVKIDDDDEAMNELLPIEVARQPFQLKYISTPLVGGFFALWSSMNDMLEVCDPGAYFLLNLNDEMWFEDYGWDKRLERYVGLFPDNIYRLRTSIYKYRNYCDNWECGFAPETSAITTKRWIDIGGNWNPCLGPDTFQQCVAFYFNGINQSLSSPRYREIPITDVSFGGEGAFLGLQGEALRRRVRGGTKAWFRLMSPEVQADALKRAAKLHAAIGAQELGLSFDDVRIDIRGRNAIVPDPRTTEPAQTFSFSFPYWRYRIRNIFRSLRFVAYGGGGREAAKVSLLSSYSLFLVYRYDWAEDVRNEVLGHASTISGEQSKVTLKQRSRRLLVRSLSYPIRGALSVPQFLGRIKARVVGLAVGIRRLLVRSLNYVVGQALSIPWLLSRVKSRVVRLAAGIVNRLKSGGPLG